VLQGFKKCVSEIFRFGLIFIFLYINRYVWNGCVKPWNWPNILLSGLLVFIFIIMFLRAGPGCNGLKNWGLSFK